MTARSVAPLSDPARESPEAHGGQSPRTARPRWFEAGLLFAASFLWFGLWTFVKPPYQAPDEIAHHLRTLALPAAPWIATSDSLPIRASEWNPLASRTHELTRLIFQPELHFRPDDVERLEKQTWLAPGEMRTQFTQAWTYPPVYYWMIFVPAEAASDAMRATPYQSVFVYRLVSCAWAAALWTLVFAAVACVEEVRRSRWSLVGFALVNPALAFVTSSINIDSVHVPLSALWLVVSFRFLAHDRWGLALPLLTLWVALTKPAAWPTFIAVSTVVMLFVVARRWPLRRAFAWAALTGAGAIAAILLFYADSPTHLYGHPSGLSTLGYFNVLRLSFPNRWAQLWGRLGWLDYQLPQVCYSLLLALLVFVAWRDRRTIAAEIGRWRFPTFAGAALVVLFVVLHVHEWWGLRERGLYLQGRYLFPLWLGTSVLIVAVRPWHRRALVGTVVAFAVALLAVSVDRYYGSWDAFVQAWPWN